MKTLVHQINNSPKDVIDKAAFLAQEIWLHQPFIDGNKRTARLLINFLTMKEGYPLFSYTEKGIYFNDMLVQQYVSQKSGLIQNFITETLENRMKEIISENQQNRNTLKGYRFML
jgi:prophage maintenance system killer protein